MPNRVIVRDLPPVDEDWKGIALAYASQRPQDGDVERFIRRWSSLHMRELREPYVVTMGKDVGLIKHMLKSATIEELLELVDYFWMHRNDEDGTTISYFKVAYNQIVRDKSDEDRTLVRKV